jgi:hypothetical protein
MKASEETRHMVYTEEMWPEKLAAELGIPPERVSESLLERIADDPEFLHHLEVCRSDPQMLHIILTESGCTTSMQTRTLAQPSGAALAARASLAVARWATSGFGRLDPEKYRQRLSICSSCEHLVEPPSTLLYKIGSKPGTKSVCGLCGCDVRRKAWLATENCPDRSAGEGGRWQLA